MNTSIWIYSIQEGECMLVLGVTGSWEVYKVDEIFADGKLNSSDYKRCVKWRHIGICMEAEAKTDYTFLRRMCLCSVIPFPSTPMMSAGHSRAQECQWTYLDLQEISVFDPVLFQEW